MGIQGLTARPAFVQFAFVVLVVLALCRQFAFGLGEEYGQSLTERVRLDRFEEALIAHAQGMIAYETKLFMYPGSSLKESFRVVVNGQEQTVQLAYKQEVDPASGFLVSTVSRQVELFIYEDNSIDLFLRTWSYGNVNRNSAGEVVLDTWDPYGKEYHYLYRIYPGGGLRQRNLKNPDRSEDLSSVQDPNHFFMEFAPSFWLNHMESVATEYPDHFDVQRALDGDGNLGEIRLVTSSDQYIGTFGDWTTIGDRKFPREAVVEHSRKGKLLERTYFHAPIPKAAPRSPE